jgi:hypothetical protein
VKDGIKPKFSGEALLLKAKLLALGLHRGWVVNATQTEVQAAARLVQLVGESLPDVLPSPAHTVRHPYTGPSRRTLLKRYGAPGTSNPCFVIGGDRQII